MFYSTNSRLQSRPGLKGVVKNYKVTENVKICKVASYFAGLYINSILYNGIVVIPFNV